MCNMRINQRKKNLILLCVGPLCTTKPLVVSSRKYISPYIITEEHFFRTVKVKKERNK